MIALLILTTQRHQDQLTERRAQFTPQIVVLSENKIAKVIALLEDQQQENPLPASHADEEARAMAISADARASLESVERVVRVILQARREFVMQADRDRVRHS